jgi:hypothetical protein
MDSKWLSRLDRAVLVESGEEDPELSKAAVQVLARQSAMADQISRLISPLLHHCQHGTASFSGSGIVIDSTNIVGVISGALTAMMGTAGTIILEASYTDPTNGGYCVGTNSGAAIIFTSTHYGTYNNTTELDTSGTITAATPSRCAYSWNASGRSIVADGGTVATDSATNPALTAIYLGAAGGDHTFAPGSYRKLAIYSSRLSDATLQTKSAVGAAF